MITHWLKSAAAMALAVAISGCGNGMTVRMGDDEGVPLAELDTSGAAPTKLVLAGPDTIVVTQGPALDIKVSGDAAAIERLRFTLADGALAVAREGRDKTPGTATIAVTMPVTEEFVLAGSGDIRAATMNADGEVNIAGSGTVAVARVDARRLDVNMMGSGTFRAAGAADRLDFNVAGSGRLAARGLKVQRAEVNIAGSGGGEFASNGKVDAHVAGSGTVTVYGRADCKISAMGSGKLRCVGADSASWGADSPAGPAARETAR